MMSSLCRDLIRAYPRHPRFSLFSLRLGCAKLSVSKIIVRSRAASPVYFSVINKRLTLKNNLWQAGHLAHVDELVVDEGRRGRGIGTLLLEELISHARALGARRIELDSAFHREAAHRFYEREGFEKRAWLFSRGL